MAMEENGFSQALLAAVEAKGAWWDREGLPALLEQYRLLHTCVRNIFDFLVKKSLITPDPYKLDKKISDITAPESSSFNENERSMKIGMRLSDYESTVDFLCNYYKFSVSNLSLPVIKKLADLNGSFMWNQFTPNSAKQNTRALAELVFRARQNLDSLTQSMVTDSLGKASKALTEITRIVKELADFQKENYKAQVRRNVFAHAGFDAAAAARSSSAEMEEIKKHFVAAMGKTPFYNDLVEEIAQEDGAPNRASLQQSVLAKLAVTAKAEQKKQVDTKAMILEAVRVLGALAPQLESALQKLNENHGVLESEHNSLLDKLRKLLRRAFNLSDKPCLYTVIVGEGEGRHREKLDFGQFTSDLAARARRFAAYGVKDGPTFTNIAAQAEGKILEFVTAQLADCNKLIRVLTGLDEFFKQAAAPANKAKIKGIKMEITSIKNCVVKANQVRAEYAAYMEEVEQMRSLGITNEG